MGKNDSLLDILIGRLDLLRLLLGIVVVNILLFGHLLQLIQRSPVLVEIQKVSMSNVADSDADSGHNLGTSPNHRLGTFACVLQNKSYDTVFLDPVLYKEVSFKHSQPCDSYQ